MGRGARHYARQKPYCPKCYSRDIQATGPTRIVQGVERVPAACRTCSNTWTSENRGILKLAQA